MLMHRCLITYRHAAHIFIILVGAVPDPVGLDIGQILAAVVFNDKGWQHTVTAQDRFGHCHILGKGGTLPTTAGMSEPATLGSPLGDFLNGDVHGIGVTAFKQIQQERQLGGSALKRALLGLSQDSEERVALVGAFGVNSGV